MLVTTRLIVLSAVLLLPAGVAVAEGSFWNRLKDPEDGRLDITANRPGASGFLPFLIPFNEPAVGAGVVVGLAYFHPREAPAVEPAEEVRYVPPSTTFGGGAFSENGTWAGAVGHAGTWNGGRTRYVGGLFGASANLGFYGIGKDPEKNENQIPFNIEAAGTVHQIQQQLGHSDFFIGGRYSFAATETTFNSAEILDGEGESDNAGLTAFLTYDTRDNVFTPNRGIHAFFGVSYFSEVLGGDADYGQLDLAGRFYWPLHRRWILGLRLEGHVVGDAAPFYALSWIRLRGVPAFRYLGNYAVTIEVEPRFRIDDRWSVLAFGGVGRAALELDRLNDAERAYNIGAGFRYLIARKLGLAVGLDIARGPEETTGYLTLGSAW